MRIFNITFLSFLTVVVFMEPVSRATTQVSVDAQSTADIKIKASKLMYQSKDGGQTWLDISASLPENKAPEDFFAGQSLLYLRLEDVLYRSKTNLTTPAWEKEVGLDSRNASIAFGHSGTIAFNYDGQLYQKVTAKQNWTPIFSNSQKNLTRGVFETSNSTILLGTDRGLYKSTDKGKNWKHVHQDGWVMDIKESQGILIATTEKGIMRSTDNGDSWELVISEGGGGIAVEVINEGFAAITASSETISRRVYISLDKGKTWQPIDAGLRPSLLTSSIKQVGNYLFCGHPDGIFRSADLGNTWHLVHSIREHKVVKYGQSWTIIQSSAENKVLTLYTSGNVLYALIKDTGC